MASRIGIHELFVARFAQDGPPLNDIQLDAIEDALNTKLPVTYRNFMTRHGVVHTPGILEKLVDKGIDHPDVQDFLEPEEVITDTTAYWSAGMPSNVIGFASDCMGNMIGFRCQAEASDDCPVVFFDHDFVEVYELAASFDAFLSWYIDHLTD